MWRSVFGSCCALLTLVVGGAEPAPAAPPSPAPQAWYVAMFSDDDWVGGGVQRVFYPGSTGPIEIEGTPAYLTVRVDQYHLTFAAPVGEELRPGGVYVDAERAPFRSPGHAGMDIHGAGRGCSVLAGHFEVKDIGVGADGTVNRLWVVYEQRCDYSGPALWGEARIGIPAPTAPLVAPQTLRWPATDTFRMGTEVPVTLVALQNDVVLGAATVSGAAATDFSVSSDECSGTTLAVGSSCKIWLGFSPGGAGTRLASLRLPDGTGAVQSVDLEAFVYGGRTRLDATGDPGDPVGDGKTWSYVGSSGRFGLGGNRTFAGFGLDGTADGTSWTGRFTPGPDDVLAAGRTYANATRWPSLASGPALLVDRNGNANSVCTTITGSFTITAADFAADGRVRSMGVSFEQHCNGAAPALRGTWEYRAGDDTPLPPWLVGHIPPPPSSLIANGSFEVDLQGWAWARATVSRVSGGFDGTHAARIALSGSGASYGLTSSPLPVATTAAGRWYEAGAHVRSLTPGRRICLVLREWHAAPGLVRIARSCVTGGATWQAFPPLRYTTRGSDGSLELYVEQSSGQPGDSFDLDAVTLRSPDIGGLTRSGEANLLPEARVEEPSTAAAPALSGGAAPDRLPNHVLGSGVHLTVL